MRAPESGQKCHHCAALAGSRTIVGSELTFVPTEHQFQVEQRILFAWCAFDTLTYPVELHLCAQITSRCPVTGSSIQLTVTPEQALNLDPEEAQVSLVVDVAARCCYNVRVLPLLVVDNSSCSPTLLTVLLGPAYPSFQSSPCSEFQAVRIV